MRPIRVVAAATLASTIVGSRALKGRWSIRSLMAGVSARKIASNFARSATCATRTKWPISTKASGRLPGRRQAEG